MAEITGRTLIDWGFEPGKWFPAAIAEASRLAADGASEDAIRAAVARHAPPPPTPLQAEGAAPFTMSIDADTDYEKANVAAVEATMRALMRTPTARAGAVMPDACPAGPVGTIPVGGVVATENAIHPGFHSADICCSMAYTLLGDVDPVRALDAGQAVTHFGGGGRALDALVEPPADLLAAFSDNPFLKGVETAARQHFATQGDGNHFLYVGRLASTGETALVTHHGSRKPGAMLYSRGMAEAEKTRRAVSPETPKQNAWIVADSAEGEAYWAALQTIRAWTRANHFAIHDQVLAALGLSEARDRYWNEHNFVFRRGDQFLHGKGATPAWSGFAADDPLTGAHTLIPLNMAEPILIVRGLDAERALGFAPHGAGRNMSRTAHMKRLEGRPMREVIREETKGVDARFYSGEPDLSELPSAYKNAAAVREQISRYGLAETVDVIEPVGSIMAGDWQKPWRAARKEQAKRRDAERRPKR